MHKRNRLVLRSIGGGVAVLTLLAAIQRLKLNEQERYMLSEVLRDVADEVEREGVTVE